MQAAARAGHDAKDTAREGWPAASSRLRTRWQRRQDASCQRRGRQQKTARAAAIPISLLMSMRTNGKGSTHHANANGLPGVGVAAWQRMSHSVRAEQPQPDAQEAPDAPQHPLVDR